MEKVLMIQLGGTEYIEDIKFLNSSNKQDRKVKITLPGHIDVSQHSDLTSSNIAKPKTPAASKVVAKTLVYTDKAIYTVTINTASKRRGATLILGTITATRKYTPTEYGRLCVAKL